ncbi:outer membrane lipoprotein carrier protein LolA [Herbiconiux sp. VKM Ac-1786]|uniref:LolA family protein n=1 Tax=Herbiconiux sp. VKM Ac-1786 TaxID=2783824 RepID=UPI00188B643A|nr:outer membrane lipoprotein carrier protein LolA [Herbiconiux sp. VKM Ac-1786]MBF4572564.1 outer membrane lipoprotein carrier protein LolA [Herbiconiux sp. VKM Ac-1786]
MARNQKRWAVAIAAPAVVAVVVAGGVLATSASADLPEKTPEQVLELAAQADVQTFSGTVEQSSDLGLPDLSGFGGAGAGSGSGGSGSSSDGSGTAADQGLSPESALELLTGSHEARVYADGSDKLRVQVLDQLAERDVVKNGDDVWLYDSSDDSAVHTTLPARGDASADASSGEATPGAVPTPADIAQRFLAAVDPSTDVSLGADTTVAGRDAYDLVLTPRTDATLVGSVSIAVDSETGMPLQVEVLARGESSPAFEIGFSDLSLDIPSAELFDFTAPEGTTVTEKALPTKGDVPEASAAHPEPVVTGEGWASVVELPIGTDTADLTSSPMFSQLTTKVDGGSLLQTTLVSVLLTDDGRVFAGAVPAEALQSAAAATPASPAE